MNLGLHHYLSLLNIDNLELHVLGFIYMSSLLIYYLDSSQYKEYSGTIIKQRFNFRCMFVGQRRA